MNILNIMKFQIMPPRVILLSPNNIISIFLFGFANCVFTGQGIVMTIDNAYDVINQDADLEYDADMMMMAILEVVRMTMMVLMETLV